MARTIPVDLEWALCGYLVHPSGRLRHVIGLDALARDIRRADAHLSWADLPGEHPAFCHVETRHILIAPWLYWVHPPYLRSILCHELAHCLVGHGEDVARMWQLQRYGDALLPAWA